ncbi:MAG: hypothetical protein H7A32_00880 [Deltaproteobacteria bacterium]|nr:hypothetical protein [Deltaproteobacteria bacterium]
MSKPVSSHSPTNNATVPPSGESDSSPSNETNPVQYTYNVQGDSTQINQAQSQPSYGTPSYKLVQKGRRSLFAGVLLGAASGAGFFLLARGNRLVNGGYEDLRNLRMIDPQDYNVEGGVSPEEAYKQREEELQSQIKRGENFRIAGALVGPILLIGAASALTVGGILYAKGKKGQQVALTPALSPSFVGASFTARF